jgi:hypothetical protein
VLLSVGVAIAFVGAGVGVAVATTTTGSGATTPAAAVAELLDAAQNSDVIGALDALDPGERSSIEPGLMGLVGELQRLDVLSSAADANNVAGVSLAFNGIETKTQYLSSDLAAVSITAGTVTSGVDPSEIPVGSFVRRLAGSALAAGARSRTTSAKSGKSAIATVQLAGTWYVSIGYTVAVDATYGGGRFERPPPTGDAVQPTGAPTAEAAVRSLLDAVTALDLRDAIAVMAPDEMAALYAYAPLFVPEEQAAIDALRTKPSIRFTSLEMSTQPLGVATLVEVSGIAFAITYGSTDITYAHGCATITMGFTTTHVCRGTADSAPEQRALDALPPAIRSLLERLATTHPQYGIVTVEEGGSWYVSPTRTVLQSADALLSMFQPGDLETIASYWNRIERQLSKAATSAAGGTLLGAPSGSA